MKIKYYSHSVVTTKTTEKSHFICFWMLITMSVSCMRNKMKPFAFLCCAKHKSFKQKQRQQLSTCIELNTLNLHALIFCHCCKSGTQYTNSICAVMSLNFAYYLHILSIHIYCGWLVGVDFVCDTHKYIVCMRPRLRRYRRKYTKCYCSLVVIIVSYILDMALEWHIDIDNTCRIVAKTEMKWILLFIHKRRASFFLW